MRVRALCATIAGLALVGPVLAVAVATPASANTIVPTRIISASTNKPFIYDSSYRDQPGVPVNGDSLSLNINVQAYVDGAWKQIYNGAIAVTRKMGTATATVASSDDAYLYGTTKAVRSATYTVKYAGGSGYAAGSVPVTYAASSVGASVQVQRNLTVSGFSGRTAGMLVKVSPSYRGNVTVLKKVGNAWKNFRTTKANSYSKVKFTLPAPRTGKFFWRIKINASGGYAKTQSATYYTRKN